MIKDITELNVGLSKYVITAYKSLLGDHPVNGSQLSRNSGIPRARIYDVLRTLKAKGFVVESSQGMYTPIPSGELVQRLRHDHESALSALETDLKDAEKEAGSDVIWRIKGHVAAMGKAKEMIDTARDEIYVRISTEEGLHLDESLKAAELRGVQVKYISMKPVEKMFEIQVIHPQTDLDEPGPEHRYFDIVVDRKEMLCGMFVAGDETNSVLNWGRNGWFVISGRDSLRHDFYHYFLHKVEDLKQPLSVADKALYRLIQKDI
jgi:sugar-specific transcriptional regulator TrmB